MSDVTTERPLSFGEKLVGMTFNPSGDPRVQKAKQLCAELADLLEEDYQQSESNYLKRVLHDTAVGDILKAQMMVVKVLTLKY